MDEGGHVRISPSLILIQFFPLLKSGWSRMEAVPPLIAKSCPSG